MNVVLLNPPYQANFIRSARSTWPSISGSNWYPIFLGYAAAYLEKEKHRVVLVDALIENISAGETVRKVANFRPELVAVYISEQSQKSDLNIAGRIKKATGAFIVLVGPWCSFQPEKLIRENPDIDGVITTEMELPLAALAWGDKPEKIPGLVWRKGKTAVVNGPGAGLQSDDLDQIPFVSDIYRRNVPLEKYHQASLLHPFIDLFTARGCVWGKCTFCLWPQSIQKGLRYRTRSVANVISELEFIRKELPRVREIFFQDDTMPAVRAREISEAIIARKLQLTWSCYSRANLDLQTLKLMKQAGCRYLHVGYESPHRHILEAISKGTNPEEMVRFTENTKKAGLRVHGDFIIGLPGETEETIRETVRWAKNLEIEGYQFFIPEPEKGTLLYGYLKKKHYLTRDGRVSYPHLNYRQLERWRFRAMREIYTSPGYIFRTALGMKTPGEFVRLARTALHVLPNLFKNR